MTMHFDTGNLFRNLPTETDKEVFEILHQRGGTKIERILSHGEATPEGQWYDQGWDEWVIIEQGTGALEFEDGTRHHMAKGDYLLIPKNTKHRVISTETNTIWLAIHLA